MYEHILPMIRAIKNLIYKLFLFVKNLSLKKKIVVIALIGIGIFFGFQQFQKTKQNQYTTVKAVRGTVEEIVSETGSIAINGKTDIYSPTNGVVKEVFVTNGESVIIGQELFTIQSSATEQEKATAQAAYLTAKNTLDTATATLFSLQSTMFSKWNTFKELAENDTYENSDGSPKYDARANPQYHIAEKDWLAAESNYKKQQAVISQAQTALSAANLAYQATKNATVKATADGTIANLSVTTGSTVKASTITLPAAPLATIATISTTEVVVSLSENDITKVADRQKASIEVNAVNDKMYDGIVNRVNMIGTDDNGVIRYKVYIEVLDADDQLRPGMNVDVTISTKKLSDVLSVPNAAVKPYQGGRAVRIPDKKTGEIIYIPVTTGIRGEKRTQILKGLKEGQEVITSLSNEQLKRPGLFGS